MGDIVNWRHGSLGRALRIGLGGGLSSGQFFRLSRKA